MLTLRRIGAGLLVVGILIATVLWLERKPVARIAIDRLFASRGVQARYDVRTIGLRWQRIENLVIGDPRTPDLTARWVEIRINRFTADAVRAGGVRLRGRLTDGRVTLGSVDRLLPKGADTTAFALPDLDVDLHDARMRLDTPYGPIGAKLEGRGNLTNGFAGTLAAVAPGLRANGCAVSRTTAYLRVTIADRAPRITGPVRAASARCKGVTLSGSALALDVTLNPALDHWRGAAAVDVAGGRTESVTLAGLGGRVTFAGTLHDTRGTADLAAASARYGDTRLSKLSLTGTFGTRGGPRGAGSVKIKKVFADPGLLAKVTRTTTNAASGPLAPILTQLVQSTRTAAQSGLAVTMNGEAGGGAVRVSRIVATGANGLILHMAGGQGLSFQAGSSSADARLAVQGGGFPAIDAILTRRADGMTLGLARIAPMTGKGSRLATTTVRFAAKPSGAMLFETTVTLDGPLGDGRVEGLRMPVGLDVAANGDVTLNRACTPLAFERLTIFALTLRPASLHLCPAMGSALLTLRNGRLGGGATASAPRLAGRIGNAPLQLTASQAHFSNGRFSVDRLALRLGDANRLSRLDIGVLDGTISGRDIRGGFVRAAGKIANVPLLVDQAAGDWTLRGGALTLHGRLTVGDEQARFTPLSARGMVLTLADGRIGASATLTEPATGVAVTNVAITHVLRTGAGHATLDVPSLRFGKTFQPEALTPVTIGVVANVVGELSGRGTIDWTPDRITSHGRFETQRMDFAAAFGPVTGLKGAITFDDLLAMTTPPHQRVTIATINPGTLVTDGAVTYRLLPGQRLAIESGAWPFAGGALLLDPTTIEMGEDRERRLTLRVSGLDAAKFIERLQFENLAATGTFDGVVPMFFDANGGRIAGGRLLVRRGGGTIAYVGEVSNAKMNVFAKLAFDALKSIRYNDLSIALDGPLDGEIVSRINFDGVNEAPLSPPKSFIARQFVGLPFVFNIKLTAPFRSLLNTARTVQDPTSLLERTLPEMRGAPVQPPESEKRP